VHGKVWSRSNSSVFFISGTFFFILMLTFSDFSSDRILMEMLCKMRVKLARDRNKDHLIHIHTGDPKYNYHNDKLSKSKEFLCSLFPPRKKWKQPAKKWRSKNGVPCNTVDKNMTSLLMTIRFYEQHHPEESFLARLNSFIQEVQQAIHQEGYKIRPPRIIPKLKEDKQSTTQINACRPLSSYGLKDKLILSVTNRFLTNLMDGIFHPESFAFRARRNMGSGFACPTHHDPVQEILTFRERFPVGGLWVSECDMKKFFDTVNHRVIKKVFFEMFKHPKLRPCSKLDLANARRIILQYLDSYTFTRNVLPLNKKQSFFDDFKISMGEFGWVEKELVAEGYYKRPKAAKIGIPQGGALSGLIANAVLHGIDTQVLAHQDGKLLYVRFCDDMILLHPKRRQCAVAFQSYIDGLRSMLLVPHNPVKPPFYNAAVFWKEKSKDCYRWSSASGGSEWIGFVGYEVNHLGHVRVRKSSLLKEMKKQYKVVGDLKLVLNNAQCRSPKNAILESVSSRLIGMSVGRVTLWNYNTFTNEMCWTSGYRLINDNKHSRIQLKRLDTSRNRLLNKLSSKLSKMKETNKLATDPIKRIHSTYFGKPFSYYYQLIGRFKKNNI